MKNLPPDFFEQVNIWGATLVAPLTSLRRKAQADCACICPVVRRRRGARDWNRQPWLTRRVMQRWACVTRKPSSASASPGTQGLAGDFLSRPGKTATPNFLQVSLLVSNVHSTVHRCQRIPLSDEDGRSIAVLTMTAPTELLIESMAARKYQLVRAIEQDRYWNFLTDHSACIQVSLTCRVCENCRETMPIRKHPRCYRHSH
ncbi:MAG: hypothetical protein JWR51_3813 [Devosia sp.]|nr:hypothetical protein [Devosia sp.]